MDVKTRYITNRDVDRVVEIHMEAFSNFFLTTLGRSFLRVYYKSFIENKEGVSICAYDNDGIILGFSVGALDGKGFHKRLILKNIIRFSIQFIRIIFTYPGAIYRLFKNMDKQTKQKIEERYSELLSIGICNIAKGKGIGSILLKRFEAELKLKSSKIVTLTTDYNDNDEVVNFYRKAGYEIFSEFTTFPDRRMYKMLKIL
jgi:ribosomal protein S18 acetylase RimI-like enzyme